jgi:hypothetical protein
MNWLRRLRWRARVLVTVIRVEYLLRRRSLPTALTALGVASGNPVGPSVPDRLGEAVGETPPLTPEEVIYLTGVDRILTLWPWQDTCLRRSVALAALLRPRGATVQVGVRRSAGRLEAHAWLQVPGWPEDPESALYAGLRLPAEG